MHAGQWLECGGVALPHHLQLHGGLPARDPHHQGNRQGEEGNPQGQPRHPHPPARDGARQLSGGADQTWKRTGPAAVMAAGPVMLRKRVVYGMLLFGSGCSALESVRLRILSSSAAQQVGQCTDGGQRRLHRRATASYHHHEVQREIFVMPRMVKSVYDRYVSIRLSLIVLGLLIVALGVVGYFFYTGDVSTKLGSLMGGLTATFVAVLIQFLLTLAHHREVERMRRMGFQDILPDRKNRHQYYADLLRDARKRIDFLGKTANSFLSDFADPHLAASQDDRLLLLAMARGVKVRILVARPDDLPEDKRPDYNRAQTRMEELKGEYPGCFDYRVLSLAPGQTFVLVDRHCIFGPVFPEESSRTSPAVHAHSDSPFLEQYFRFFDRQWRSGEMKGVVSSA